jgi:hypothetical protein
MDPDSALKECKNRCKSYAGNLTEECIDKCELDYSAVEGYEEEGSKSKRPLQVVFKGSGIVEDGRSGGSEGSKISLWGIIAGVAVVLFIVAMIVIALKSKKSSRPIDSLFA